jgi:hypothetical protein
MQEQHYLGRLEPGMDVCDVDGNKFGAIERVYRQEMAPVGASDASDIGTVPREDIVQVKTGLLGLGKHFYIPFSAVQDVTPECVLVKQSKDRIEEMGWDVRPDFLDNMGLGPRSQHRHDPSRSSTCSGDEALASSQ